MGQMIASAFLFVCSVTDTKGAWLLCGPGTYEGVGGTMTRPTRPPSHLEGCGSERTIRPTRMVCKQLLRKFVGERASKPSIVRQSRQRRAIDCTASAGERLPCAGIGSGQLLPSRFSLAKFDRCKVCRSVLRDASSRRSREENWCATAPE